MTFREVPDDSDDDSDDSDDSDGIARPRKGRRSTLRQEREVVHMRSKLADYLL